VSVTENNNNIMLSKLYESGATSCQKDIYLKLIAVHAMESVKELLALRKQIKARKPSFVREESWRYKRVRESWRKPRGIDSHMRKRKKGWPKLVKIGYRGPKAARYLHPSGYYDILVHNVAELGKLDHKKDAARIASAVGKKKRKEIVDKAKTMKIKVLNP